MASRWYFLTARCVFFRSSNCVRTIYHSRAGGYVEEKSAEIYYFDLMWSNVLSPPPPLPHLSKWSKFPTNEYFTKQKIREVLTNGRGVLNDANEKLEYIRLIFPWFPPTCLFICLPNEFLKLYRDFTDNKVPVSREEFALKHAWNKQSGCFFVRSNIWQKKKNFETKRKNDDPRHRVSENKRLGFLTEANRESAKGNAFNGGR